MHQHLIPSPFHIETLMAHNRGQGRLSTTSRRTSVRRHSLSGLIGSFSMAFSLDSSRPRPIHVKYNSASVDCVIFIQSFRLGRVGCVAEAPGARPSDSQAHFQTHSRSKTAAKPCPTPTQSDTMPREAPVRAIWWISVVARRAPLQPSG